jgi:hypothetical protein
LIDRSGEALEEVRFEKSKKLRKQDVVVGIGGCGMGSSACGEVPNLH